MEEEQQAVDSLEAVQAALVELRQLVKSSGWARLLRVAQEQVDTRTNTLILTPLESMDRMFEQEFKKGEISGIRLFLSLPESAVESLSQQVKEMQDAEET